MRSSALNLEIGQTMTIRIGVLVIASLIASPSLFAQQAPARGQAPAELVQLATEFRYYLNPSAGTSYPAGKYQIETLVANLRRQLDTRFDLRAAHDRFMEAGPIPIVLIEWELTGDDSSLEKVLAHRATARQPQPPSRGRD
jgi:hypothetical protein